MRTYMPILKWKQGEQAAVQSLDSNVSDRVIPMFELVEDDSEPDEGQAPHEWLASLASKLFRVRSAYPCYFDARVVDSGSLQSMFDAFRSAGCAAIPVARHDDDPAAVLDIEAIAQQDGRGLALRVDMSAGIGVLQALPTFGISLSQVDLVLDWGYVESSQISTIQLGVLAVLSKLPNSNAWRSVVVSMSSFPSLLNGTGVYRIPRVEWPSYRAFLALSAVRPPAFSDYAIAHPVYKPSPFLGSASIRYTVDDEWMIVRGRSVKGPVYGGFNQFVQLSQQLVLQPEYSGPTFSWGDKYIHDCANKTTSTGNMTTWRKVGTSHHVTFVAHQVGAYLDPSSGLAPPHIGP